MSGLNPNRQGSHRLLILALTAAAVAVGGVVWWTMARRERPPAPVQSPLTSPQVSPEVARLQAVGDALRTIRIGMPRVDVERQLGSPAPKHTFPLIRVGDKLVYRTAYQALVREPLPLAPEARGFIEAVLEYDASRPGHPLLRLTCSPKPPPQGIVAIEPI